MAHPGIRACNRERMAALCILEDLPGGVEEDESSEYKEVAQYMYGIEMRISFTSEQCFPQVSRIVREEIELWIVAA